MGDIMDDELKYIKAKFPIGAVLGLIAGYFLGIKMTGNYSIIYIIGGGLIGKYAWHYLFNKK